MGKNKLVPMEPTPEMMEAGAEGCGQDLDRDEARGRAVMAYKAMLAAAPDVQAEPVGWQFYQDGKWWGGDDRIKDHRKNTEEAGYLTRDVYAAPQPAPDVAELIVLLEHAQCPNCDGSGARHDNYGEPEQCQWCHERAEALAAHRKQGDRP